VGAWFESKTISAEAPGLSDKGENPLRLVRGFLLLWRYYEDYTSIPVLVVMETPDKVNPVDNLGREAVLQRDKAEITC
jgi:hypothetical protein